MLRGRVGMSVVSSSGASSTPTPHLSRDHPTCLRTLSNAHWGEDHPQTLVQTLSTSTQSSKGRPPGLRGPSVLQKKENAPWWLGFHTCASGVFLHGDLSCSHPRQCSPPFGGKCGRLDCRICGSPQGGKVGTHTGWQHQHSGSSLRPLGAVFKRR